MLIKSLISVLLSGVVLLAFASVSGVSAVSASVSVFDYTATVTADGFFGFDFFDTEPSVPLIINSRPELEAHIKNILRDYKQANNGVENPEWRYMLAEFTEAANAFYANFDERFFANNYLVIALVDRGSGSLQFKTTNVSLQENTLVVTIGKTVPAIQTMDYCHWFLLLSISNTHRAGTARVVLETTFVEFP